MNIEYYRKKIDYDTDSIIFEKVKEEDITICGYKLEEVIKILNGLELEKKTGILMTINNLQKYIDLYDSEVRKVQQKAIEDMNNKHNID